MKKLTWEVFYALDMAMACALSHAIIIELRDRRRLHKMRLPPLLPRQGEPAMTTAQTSSTSSGVGLKLMTVVLSLIAGSMDVISFLGLGGLFTAHITGNLVILAAHLATGGAAQAAPMLSVPVFMAALFLARLAAGILERIGFDSLRPLLLLQFLLLAGCLAICSALGSDFDPNAETATIAGMIAVCALGVQNALVQVSLPGSPTTAVLTTNVARFTTDIGTILLGAGRAETGAASRRADKIWPAILGFVVGCCIGAVCEARYGLIAVALPTGLALIAFAMAWAAPFTQTDKPTRLAQAGR